MSPYMRDFLQNNQRFFTLLHVERPKSSNMKSARHGISIHSPLTGRDDRGLKPDEIDKDFNPLSPHGERQERAVSRGEPRGISIHSPLTGRDEVWEYHTFGWSGFQSTLPSRGETECQHQGISSVRNFNPLSPHGERRNCVRHLEYFRDISIHSPLTGRDGLRAYFYNGHIHFNPLSPHGERP